MGYPMTYERVILRNHLGGNYAWDKAHPPELPALEMLIGDLRRLETDQLDERHLANYSAQVGITIDQARMVLTMFFKGYF